MVNQKRQFTLRQILVISFTVISAIPALFLASWIQQSAVEKEFEAVNEKHLIIAKNLTRAIERYVEDVKSVFRVATSEDNHHDKQTEEVNYLLSSLYFEHVWLISHDNTRNIFPAPSEENIPQDVMHFVDNNLQNSKPVKNSISISGVLKDNQGEPSIALFQFIEKNKYGVALIKRDYILEVQSAIVFGERGHAAIVDQHGKVMAHPVENWHQTMKDVSFLPPVKNMLTGNTGVTQFYTPAMQADMIAGHTVVKNTGWGVMIPQPISELYDRANYARQTAIIIAILGVAFAALISWWLSNYITRSLKRVTNFTENVASGELDAYISIEKGFNPVEITTLVNSFNRMIEKIKLKSEEFLRVNNRLKEAQNIAKLGNWKLNISDNTMWWSDEVYKIFDINKNDMASPTLDIMVGLMDESQKNHFLEKLKNSLITKRPFTIDCKKQSLDGNYLHYQQDVVIQTGEDSEISFASGTIQDVTERKQQEEALFFQANHDSLTQLPNRDFCVKTLEDCIVNAKNNDRILPLLHIGLDHFKEVNGSLGHNIGDKLLSIAGTRIKEIIAEDDFIARLGSDEFAVILNSAKNEDDIQNACEKIIASFQSPIDVDYFEATIGASIGISVYPHFDALNPLLMLQKADTALHKAKAEGKGTYRTFNSEMDEHVMMRMNIRSDLSTAIKNEEFHLVFQPIVDSKTGKVICAESLIRWIHPSRGFIPPDKFISIAEESGYISEIGHWVIDQACAELKKWHSLGHSDLYISVNLSIRQIQLGLSKQDILTILNKYKLEPKYLTLEVTESLLMEDLDRNLSWLNDVRSTGIRFSIDDFGTGYSSLSYLLNLPVSTLKIDRAFISNVLVGSKDETLIEMIITLSKKLGYKVVAEGVETQGQLDKLNEYDCDLIQGYFFSKPLKSDEFVDYLKQS